MLRIVAVSILLCCYFLAHTQEDYSVFLEKAKLLHKKEKNIEGAIELLDSVWNSCKSETATSEGCIKILTYLAFYCQKNRDYDTSLEHYLMMIEYDKEGYHHCKAYHFISQILNKKRNHSLALDMALKGYNHKKIDCRWKYNLSHTTAKSIMYLGDSSMYQQALAWIDTSLMYYQQCGSGNAKTIVNRLMDKGSLLLKLGNIPQAIEAYNSCTELLDNTDKFASLKYKVNNNIGTAHSYLDNHSKAIEYYKKSIDLYNKKNWNYSIENLSILHRNMARICRDRLDFNGALEWIEKSDNYLEDCLQSDSTLLAAIYRDKIWNRKEELFNYAESYLISKDKNDLLEAYEAGKFAFTQYLMLRSMVFGDNTKMIGLQEIKSTLDQFVKVCLELGKIDEAFFIAEKTKYLNLLEHLDHFDASSIDQVATQLQLIPTSFNDLRKAVGANNRGDIYLGQEKEEFNQSLNLGDSSVIYSYYLHNENYILFIHKNGTTHIEYLEESEMIDSLLDSFLKTIEKRAPIDSIAHKLSALLLPQRAENDTNIILVPHGHLTKLPFAALKKDNKFLITRIELNYKKSLFLPNTVYNSDKRLGIQPHYSGKKRTGKLPFAKSEAEHLRKKFGFEVLQKDDATVDNLTNLNTELDVMHIIGHCTMDTENYRNSFFSLSNDEKWTPLDILKAALKSNLLVLSACSTSDGEFDLEEGIRGISYIFNITGNNNQITTNWSVDDEANFTIFKSFYHYLDGKNTVGQALRLSQIEYMENASFALSHPYYWAGMRYEGNPSLKIEMAPIEKKNYSIFIIGAILILGFFLIVKK